MTTVAVGNRRRPCGVFKKGSDRTDPGAALLRKVSKAALLDLALDLIGMDGKGSCDEEVSVERVRTHLAPVLERRGDRMPKVLP